MNPTSPFLPLPSHLHPTQLQRWPREPARGSPRPPQGRQRRGHQDAWGPDGHGDAELGSHLAHGGPGHLCGAENCSGEKQRDEGTASSQAQLQGLSTEQRNQPLTYITQLVPGPQSEGEQLPGKARRSQNKGGCCLIHNKDNFLKLVQPGEQRTESPAWLYVQGKVQQGRGFMGCPGDSWGLAQAGSHLTAWPASPRGRKSSAGA